MLGEYERVKVVVINHSCGCKVEQSLNYQPGFSQIVAEMEAKACAKCREALSPGLA